MAGRSAHRRRLDRACGLYTVALIAFFLALAGLERLGLGHNLIGLAGTLYLGGYSGLAFVIGWTGGYCLVALLLAP